MQEFAACKVPSVPGAAPKLFPLKREILKIVLVMKITVILLLAAALQVSAKGWSQEKINLSVTDAPLEQVFNSIKSQAGVVFFYRPQYVKGKKVTIKVTNASLKTVLDLCLKDQQLFYEVVGKTVAISPTRKNSTSNVDDIENIPPIDVKGRVVNERGDPVEGVTVKVKGSDKIAVTDANGEFSIVTTDQNAVLLFTHISMEAFELKVEGRRELAIKLKSKISALDELQVIAYGTTTKRLNTGNVATVKAIDIQKQPVSNPLSALQGRVPGLVVTQANGLPGGGITVQIQGQNSLVYGNDPLYVVDGVPFPSQRLSTNISTVLGYSGVNTFASAQNGNPLNYINPNDIESIEVLKDADATSIYGSRAANGAILITTKKGKAGKTRFDFNLQNGWGTMTRRVDMLNTEQYIAVRREGLKNDNRTATITDYDINGTWDSTRYTDWQDELLGGTAKYADAQFTVSGGSGTTNYIFGANYHKETTVFPGDFNYRKGSLHAQFNTASANQKFKLQFTGNYVADKNLLPTNDYTDMAVYSALAPNAPALHNSDGSLNWAPNSVTGQSTWSGAYTINPLAINYRTLLIRSSNLISNAVLSYQIIPSLELKSSFGYNKVDVKENSKFPNTSFDPYIANLRGNDLRSANYANSSIATWLIEPQISFKKTIGKGTLDVLVGSTIQQQESEGQTLNGRTFVSDLLLEDIRSAATVTVTNSIASVYKYNALFGRINYNWDNKYILNITGRRDGSSRFGPKSQFHEFGSAGISWIFSKENFVQDLLPFLSFGKLRTSYGTTGNDQIPDYLYMSLYPSSTVQVPYQGVNGLITSRLTNPYLQWEETKKLQAGLDLGFFRDRFNLTINFYRNRSSNQLLPYSLPYVAGFNNIQQNLPATIQNYGWEFAVNGQLVKTSAFNWNSYFNITIPRNKLVSFPNIINTTYASYLKEGDPFTLSPLFQYMGVNATTGLYEFVDKDGNLSSTAGSNVAAKMNVAPRLFGGLQNTFSYKGIELDIFFQFSRQNGPTYRIGNLPGKAFANQPATVLERWQKPGEDAPIQRFFGGDAANLSAFSSAQFSDFAFGDASYIRLKNVSLSWRLPDVWMRKMHLQTMRVYALGQNLATITDYVGLDPETMNQRVLPPLRVITVGVQIGL